MDRLEDLSCNLFDAEILRFGGFYATGQWENEGLDPPENEGMTNGKSTVFSIGDTS